MPDLDELIRDGLRAWADDITVAGVRTTRPARRRVTLVAAAAVLVAMGLVGTLAAGGGDQAELAPGGPTAEMAPGPTLTPSIDYEENLAYLRSLPTPTGSAADRLTARLLPLVRFSYEQWEWPLAHDTTPEAILQARLPQLAIDETGEQFAGSMADTVNLCAWALQLRDDVSTGMSQAQSRQRLALHAAGSESRLKILLAAADRADTSTMQRAIDSECVVSPLR